MMPSHEQLIYELGTIHHLRNLQFQQDTILNKLNTLIEYVSIDMLIQMINVDVL